MPFIFDEICKTFGFGDRLTYIKARLGNDYGAGPVKIYSKKEIEAYVKEREGSQKAIKRRRNKD